MITREREVTFQQEIICGHLGTLFLDLESMNLIVGDKSIEKIIDIDIKRYMR